MGAWGTAIFSDDFACDIRDDYVEQLVKGKNKEEATQLVIDLYYSEVKGTDDEPVFWFALALTQWNKGRLQNEVKMKAIEYIDNGFDLNRWDSPGNEKNYKKRREVLQKLKDTLLSPMPKEKKIQKPSWIWTSPWSEGALLTYRIKDERSVKDYIGKFVLLRVIKVIGNEKHGYTSESIGIGLYGWAGDEIPDSSIANNLEFVLIRDITNPITGRTYEKILEAIFTKKDQKERNIVCIGNDPSYKTSPPEFFKEQEGFLSYAPPGTLDTLVSKALDKYFKGE